MTQETPKHEMTDMRPKYVFYFGILLTVSAVFIHIGLLLMFDYFLEHPRGTEYQPTRIRIEHAPPAEPRLQVDPTRDYQTMVKAEREHLNTYGWIDRQAGTAWIPIDRAMDIIVERDNR